MAGAFLQSDYEKFNSFEAACHMISLLTRNQTSKRDRSLYQRRSDSIDVGNRIDLSQSCIHDGSRSDIVCQVSSW